MSRATRKVVLDRRHEIERSLAPHVDVLWADALVVDLGRAGVASEDVLHTLKRVEARCAETGGSAADEFGDPVTYARGLGLASVPGLLRRNRILFAHRLGPVAVGMLGTLLCVTGAAAVRAGTDAVLTSGLLVSAGVFGLAVLALVRICGIVRRIRGPRATATAVALAVLCSALLVIAPLVLDAPVLAVDALITASVGWMLVVGSAATDLTLRKLARPRRSLLGALRAPGATLALLLGALLG